MKFYHTALIASTMALSMISSAVNAQSNNESNERVKIGIRAGISSISTFGVDDFDEDMDDEDHDPFKKSALPGLRAGVSVICPIVNHWGVETGAYYQQYGGTNKTVTYGYTEDDDSECLLRDSWTVKTRLHGISVPVMCHYGRQFGVNGSMYWDAFAGPYARFSFSGKSKVKHSTYAITAFSGGKETATYTKENTTTDALDESEVRDLLNEMGIQTSDVTINKAGAGVLFGGGVTFFNHLYAGVSFDFGLSSVMKFDNGFGRWDDKYRMRNSAMSFNIGYTF